MEATIETPAITDETFDIPEGNYQVFLEKIEKLNRRADRLGCSRIHIMEMGVETREVRKMLPYPTLESAPDNGSIVILVDFHKVQVFGYAPQLNGWTLVGVLNHGEEGTIVNTVPGETVPQEFFGHPNMCDHCHTERRRTDTFVVRHDEQSYKQVGRNCLADFLGHQSPQVMAGFAELMRDARDLAAEGENHGGHFAEYSLPMEEYLQVVSDVIFAEGWLSRSKAYDQGGIATADIAWEVCTDPRGRFNQYERTTPRGMETARAALEWAKTAYRTDGTEYEHNMATIVAAGTVRHKTAGYAASIISGYIRHLNDEKTKAEKAAEKPSEWVGTVGERQEMTLTLKSIFPIEKEWPAGVTYLHTFVDDAGNTIKWFGSTTLELKKNGPWNPDNELQEGDTGRVKATVTRHTEWKGRKETAINRPVLLSLTKAEATE